MGGGDVGYVSGEDTKANDALRQVAIVGRLRPRFWLPTRA